MRILLQRNDKCNDTILTKRYISLSHPTISVEESNFRLTDLVNCQWECQPMSLEEENDNQLQIKFGSLS